MNQRELNSLSAKIIKLVYDELPDAVDVSVDVKIRMPAYAEIIQIDFNVLLKEKPNAEKETKRRRHYRLGIADSEIRET